MSLNRRRKVIVTTKNQEIGTISMNKGINYRQMGFIRVDGTYGKEVDSTNYKIESVKREPNK